MSIPPTWFICKQNKKKEIYFQYYIQIEHTERHTLYIIMVQQIIYRFIYSFIIIIIITITIIIIISIIKTDT